MVKQISDNEIYLLIKYIKSVLWRVAKCLFYIEESRCLKVNIMGLDSSVGIAARYGLDGPEIESRWEARFSAPVQTGPGAHPLSYTMGTGSFPEVNRPGRGIDHSLLSSTEVKETVQVCFYTPYGPSWPVLG